MENLLNYAIQINVLLAIVYLGYTFLLKSLTFYKLNRTYFIVGILFSFVYPFLNVQSWFAKPIPSVGELVMDWSVYFDQEEAPPIFSLNNLLVILLLIGVVILFTRFIIQMISLLRIHIYSEPAQWQSYLFRNVFIPIVPFSFLNKIYVNRDHHDEPELLDIFKHEDIHVKGLHSIDILISEFTLISSWFNPFVWLIRKAIRENLEFLTDQQVLNNGVDRQTYQYSLLRVNSNGATGALGNQFSFKTLKRRIMMMNKKRSSKIQMSKYAFMLPVFILTAGAFTLNKAEAKITEVVQIAKEADVSHLLTPDTVLVVKMKGKDGELLKKNTGSDTIRINVPKSDLVSNDTLIIPVSSKGTRFFLFDGDKPKHDSMFVYNQINFVAEESPYILLDNKEVNPDVLKSLSPDYIESITVLKKEQGKKRYANKGKNGVIIITSKKGSSFESTDASFLSKLEGKVSGLTIKADTLSRKGLIPSSVSIRAGQDPLFVVDGKIQEKDFDMKSINSYDIESIEILKNASATALYGSRGVNGVIMITKKGSNSSEKKVELQGKEVVVKGYKKNPPEGYKTDEVTVVGFKKNDDSSDKKAVFQGRSQYRTLDFLKLKNPAYIVNGNIISKEEYKKINLDNIGEIKEIDKVYYKNFINAKLDLDKYDGVILVEIK